LCPFTAAVRQPAVASYVEMTLPAPPVPKPRTRINGEYNDYANLVPIEEDSGATSVDNNNNNNGNGSKLRLVRHSPTPDYPPPTVTEAERTIFDFMQPATLRKDSLLESGESPRTTNSMGSDLVEEYVADNPFAGLFKGSTLNLSSDVVDEPHTHILLTLINLARSSCHSENALIPTRTRTHSHVHAH